MVWLNYDSHPSSGTGGDEEVRHLVAEGDAVGQVTLTPLSSGATWLLLVYANTDAGVVQDDLVIRPNGDADETHYHNLSMETISDSADPSGSWRDNLDTGFLIRGGASGLAGTGSAVATILIANPSAADRPKIAMYDAVVYDFDSVDIRQYRGSDGWNQVDPITSIDILPAVGSVFQAGSLFVLRSIP